MTDESADDKVMQFTCDHCDISLTVDEALAGVTGPCPSCGKVITAPALPVPKPIPAKPRKLQARNQAVSGRTNEGGYQPREYRPGRRISPEIGGFGARRERAEVTAVAKMLVAGLVVLVIVLGVTYLLRQSLGTP